MLLSVAQTQRERQLISYGIVKSLGLSSESAKHHFGITRVPNRIARVQQTITDMQTLREFINQISHVKEKSILQILGLDVDSEMSESNENEEYSSDTNDGGVSRQACGVSNEDVQVMEVTHVIMLSYIKMVSHIKVVPCTKEVVSHVKLVVSHIQVMMVSYIKMESHINHVKEMASHVKLVVFHIKVVVIQVKVVPCTKEVVSHVKLVVSHIAVVVVT
eukprot:Em0007g720a